MSPTESNSHESIPGSAGVSPDDTSQRGPDAVIEPEASLSFFRSEDWAAIVVALLCLGLSAASVLLFQPVRVQELATRHGELKTQLGDLDPEAQDYEALKKNISSEIKEVEKQLAPTPLKSYVFKASEWTANPLDALKGKNGPLWQAVVATFVLTLLLLVIGALFLGKPLASFVGGYFAVYFLALLAFIMTAQVVIQHYNLEYALWALVLGLLISNTIGTPRWVQPAVRTEFYIKTGLILLGAEVLFNKLLALSVPGICISWIVTPVVLIATYLFGQYVLKIQSKSLNLVISADMSVCGVSAAIATAAACKAKKEELSLAIGLSLAFTVVMMVVMPWAIKAMGMSEVLGGAWIGGTIDSTGAVAAAGEMLGDTALEVATTVKMIQNILIGVIGFAVAVYWVSMVEKSAEGKRPSVYEIWRRFPKFTLCFVAVSIVFSYLNAQGVEYSTLGNAIVDGSTKNLRGWFFCLGFVSIGLESNFKEMKKTLSGGKPLVLYVCGQALNLVLTLSMAWLMFEVVFPGFAAK